MEKKYTDQPLGSTAITNTGTLYEWTNIAGGAGYNVRVGNKIRIRYLRLACAINSNGVNGIYMRVSVVRARTKGLVIGDCPTFDQNQFWDVDKWHVMYDKVYSLGNSDVDGRDRYNIHRTFKVFKDCQYDSAVSTSVVTNPMYLFFWSNDTIAPSPYITGYIRTTFSDLI